MPKYGLVELIHIYDIEMALDNRSNLYILWHQAISIVSSFQFSSFDQIHTDMQEICKVITSNYTWSQALNLFTFKLHWMNEGFSPLQTILVEHGSIRKYSTLDKGQCNILLLKICALFFQFRSPTTPMTHTDAYKTTLQLQFALRRKDGSIESTCNIFNKHLGIQYASHVTTYNAVSSAINSALSSASEFWSLDKALPLLLRPAPPLPLFFFFEPCPIGYLRETINPDSFGKEKPFLVSAKLN